MHPQPNRVLVVADVPSELISEFVSSTGCEPIRCATAAQTIAELVEHADEIRYAVIGASRRWDGLREFLRDAFPRIERIIVEPS